MPPLIAFEMPRDNGYYWVVEKGGVFFLLIRAGCWPYWHLFRRIQRADARRRHMLNKDISSMLKGWEYDPSRVTARWIKGEDGKTKIQLRLDLGLFQMEVEGRPDGRMPRGYPSLLDYYTTLEKTSMGRPVPKLGDMECGELQQEAVQYYYRYLSLYALRHYEGVIRDTRHNLRVMELVERHAEDEDLVWDFQQFYPYVRMMNAKATAEQFTEGGRNEYDMAIMAVEEALADIAKFWKKYSDPEWESDMTSDEEESLLELLDQLKQRRPRSHAERIREDLARAIAVENYEKAAHLRDALSRLDNKNRKPGRPRETRDRQVSS